MKTWVISSICLVLLFALTLYYYYSNDEFKSIFWAIMTVNAVIIYKSINFNKK